MHRWGRDYVDECSSGGGVLTAPLSEDLRDDARRRGAARRALFCEEEASGERRKTRGQNTYAQHFPVHLGPPPETAFPGWGDDVQPSRLRLVVCEAIPYRGNGQTMSLNGFPSQSALISSERKRGRATRCPCSLSPLQRFHAYKPVRPQVRGLGARTPVSAFVRSASRVTPASIVLAGSRPRLWLSENQAAGARLWVPNCRRWRRGRS